MLIDKYANFGDISDILCFFFSFFFNTWKFIHQISFSDWPSLFAIIDLVSDIFVELMRNSRTYWIQTYIKQTLNGQLILRHYGYLAIICNIASMIMLLFFYPRLLCTSCEWVTKLKNDKKSELKYLYIYFFEFKWFIYSVIHNAIYT